MKRISAAPLPRYTATHVSALDASPAMVISTYSGHTVTLMNECGDTWTDPIDQWLTLQESEDATWTEDDHGNWSVVR